MHNGRTVPATIRPNTLYGSSNPSGTAVPNNNPAAETATADARNHGLPSANGSFLSLPVRFASIAATSINTPSGHNIAQYTRPNNNVSTVTATHPPAIHAAFPAISNNDGVNCGHNITRAPNADTQSPISAKARI